MDGISKVNINLENIANEEYTKHIHNLLEPRNGRPTESAGRTSEHPAHSVCRRPGDPNPWKQQKGT